MGGTALGNIVAWSAQAAAVAVLGVALPAIVRIGSPRLRLWYYRALLCLCLALPWLQPWRPLPEGSATSAVAVSGLVFSAAAEVREQASAMDALTPRLGWYLLVAYAAGVLLRLAWLGLGAWSLARLRRTAVPVQPMPAAVGAAVALTGVSADFRISGQMQRPATFGWRRPVVLLPPEYSAFPAAQQTAIAVHELLHVRRGDWAAGVIDRLILTVCWCHPAVWWLAARIHLSVEQVVDREVVDLVGERKPYLDALLRLAACSPGPFLQPASLFLKHGHLAQRVTLLVREVSMSRFRLALSSALVAGLLIAGAWATVLALPLHLTAPYPDPTAASGPAAADAVLQAPPPSKPAQPASTATQPAAKQAAEPWKAVPPNAMRVGKGMQPPVKVKDVKPVYPEAAAAGGIQGVVIIEAVIDEAGKVSAARVLRSVPTLDDAALTAVRQWEFRPTLLNGAAVPVVMTVTVNFTLADGPGKAAQAGVAGGVPGGVKGGVAGGVPGGVAGGAGADVPAGAVRIGDNVPAPAKTKDVKAVYPETARDARIQGIVILDIVISQDGKVTGTKIQRSIPELDQAAIDAVKQWEFAPTVIAGKAVPVIMTITVNFTLK